MSIPVSFNTFTLILEECQKAVDTQGTKAVYIGAYEYTRDYWDEQTDEGESTALLWSEQLYQLYHEMKRAGVPIPANLELAYGGEKGLGAYFAPDEETIAQAVDAGHAAPTREDALMRLPKKQQKILRKVPAYLGSHGFTMVSSQVIREWVPLMPPKVALTFFYVCSIVKEGTEGHFAVTYRTVAERLGSNNRETGRRMMKRLIDATLIRLEFEGTGNGGGDHNRSREYSLIPPDLIDREAAMKVFRPRWGGLRAGAGRPIGQARRHDLNT